MVVTAAARYLTCHDIRHVLLVLSFRAALRRRGDDRRHLPAFEIIFLWLSIIATIGLFRPVREATAYSWLPCLVWVSFAAVLCFRVWRLKPRDAADEADQQRLGQPPRPAPHDLLSRN